MCVAGHAAWSARRSCAACAREGCEIVDGDARRARSDAPGRGRATGSRRDAAAGRVSSPRRRSAASSPTTPTRREFLRDNLLIETNVIDAAWQRRRGEAAVPRLVVHLPEARPQPIAEDTLLTGPLEPTNEWYAIAKIAGIKLCQAYRRQYGCDFISAMPTNLYGPGDNYDLETSHVLPALIRKAHEAKLQRRAATVTIWGTGTPRREFLHVDDCADALVHIMQRLFRGGARSTSAPARTCTIVELAAPRSRGRRLQGRHRVRHVEARRHAAQAHERRQARSAGLETSHWSARRAAGAYNAFLAGSSGSSARAASG